MILKIIGEKKSLILMSLCPVLLSACGGGDGGGTFCGYDDFGNPIFCQPVSTPTPPTPVSSNDIFLVSQALSNIATQTYSYSVSGYDSYGNQYTISYSSSPGIDASVNGQAASTTNVTESYYENGSLLQVDSFVNYFVLSPYHLLESIGNFPGGVEIVGSSQAVQATGTVGQAFPEFSATLYRDSTQSVSDGTLSETIQLAADTPSTALLCFNDTLQLTQAGVSDNLVGGVSSNCFRIDSNGNLQGMQITTPINGSAMLFF